MGWHETIFQTNLRILLRRLLEKFMPETGRAKPSGNDFLVDSRADLPEDKCKAHAIRTPLQRYFHFPEITLTGLKLS